MRLCWIFNAGKMLKQINATTITMIPKVKNPSSMNEYRPISCCNTLYKYISKMLCNRLRKVLPKFIGESQCAFVEGRCIIQNVLICQKLTKGFGRKNNKPKCLMKIDLKKACDSVNWEFIEEMMAALQFPWKFIRWIMACVSSTSFSLMINGSLCRFFKGEKGLRQGDPISPLLFVICMEYLSRILKEVSRYQGFNFYQGCRLLKMCHMTFADDLILFCGGDYYSMFILLRGFATFSATSRLEANKGKSEIYMTCNVDTDTISRIVESSGYKLELPFRYMGYQ